MKATMKDDPKTGGKEFKLSILPEDFAYFADDIMAEVFKMTAQKITLNAVGELMPQVMAKLDIAKLATMLEGSLVQEALRSLSRNDGCKCKDSKNE